MRCALLLCASSLVVGGCSPRHGLVAFPSDDGPRLPATAPASVRVVASGAAPRAGCRPVGWVAANVTVPTAFGSDDPIVQAKELAARLGATDLQDVRIQKAGNGFLLVKGLAVACPAVAAP